MKEFGGLYGTLSLLVRNTDFSAFETECKILMDGQRDGRKDRWIAGQTDGQMDRWMDSWTDEWIDE